MTVAMVGISPPSDAGAPHSGDRPISYRRRHGTRRRLIDLAEPCSAVPSAPASTQLPAPSAAVKVYGSGSTTVRALDGVDVAIPEGRFTAVMGPSGSGKSTLLHCLAGLDTLTSGQVFIGDVELGRLSDRQLTRVRREQLGFVFQSFNLVPTLNAKENITAAARPRRAQARRGVGATR